MRVKISAVTAAFLAAFASSVFAQNMGTAVDVMSGGKAYASYLAASLAPGKKPGIVLIHSFNGLEQGYKDLVDRFASDGFVVLAVTTRKTPISRW